MTEQNNSLMELWQEQKVEGVTMSIDQIRKRASKFEQRIKWRNVREYVSSLVAAILFAGFMFRTHDIVLRAAYVIFILGLAWVVIQLHRKGSSKSLPGAMGASVSLQYFRAELERQRDVVQNVWSWYLAPLVPGFIVLSIGYIRSMPHPKGLLAAGILDVAVAILFFIVWKMNMRAARCLQRMIDETRAAEN